MNRPWPWCLSFFLSSLQHNIRMNNFLREMNQWPTGHDVLQWVIGIPFTFIAKYIQRFCSTEIYSELNNWFQSYCVAVKMSLVLSLNQNELFCSGKVYTCDHRVIRDRQLYGQFFSKVWGAPSISEAKKKNRKYRHVF